MDGHRILPLMMMMRVEAFDGDRWVCLAVVMVVVVVLMVMGGGEAGELHGC